MAELYDHWILQNRLYVEHFSVKCTIYEMKQRIDCK